MIVPMTLAKYLARQLLQNFLVVLGIMLGVVWLMDTFELLRRTAGREHFTMGLAVEMGLLKLPEMAMKTAPFVILIGGILALAKLTRSQELIVARSAGISVWQLLAPALGLVGGLGLIVITLFNPLAAVMLSRFEQLEAKHVTGRPSMLTVSAGGLWLRQPDQDGEKIVHAMRIDQQAMELFEVIIFVFDHDTRFIKRVDAKSATLTAGEWRLKDALITAPNSPPQRESALIVPTTLTANQIQDSFASPETLSFWQLTGFISTLEKAGFSALRHRLHWHATLATPLLYSAMILIATTFAFRIRRGRGAGYAVSAGVLSGFIIYFLSDLVYALGLSTAIPVVMAAWAPAAVTTFAGVALLLHFEDG